MRYVTAAVSLAFVSCVACAQPAWSVAEAGWLSGHTPLTSRAMFTRAGEAYFSPDGTRIIFQATPVPEDGEAASPHYEMYTASIAFDAAGFPKGLGDITMLSSAGSANTCGWFHPTEPDVVLFGSTLVAPSAEDQPGYQRESGRYAWAFPREMNIMRATWAPGEGLTSDPAPIFERPGYTAEGSWSPDGRFVLYAQVDEAKSERLGRGDADLFVYDTAKGAHTALVVKDGYDGGPFFSPDGRWICYRSDRRGDNLLQLFVAELAFDDAADPDRITGIRREIQLTDNQDVNWAPYWHPSGRFLVYATSSVSHQNYEVFAVPVFDAFGMLVDVPTPVRVTHAADFDGLPVFSPDGRFMMWTAQRGEKAEGEATPSSQLWIAEVSTAGLLALIEGSQRGPE